ncbi:histidine kinase [Actinoplanes sp. NPDC048967]|uniref:sensor histidine kinase n=1 Tax=Actinoplanes sp. NPDC048967 TaxID=3155269 RepID=UPI00340885EF
MHAVRPATGFLAGVLTAVLALICLVIGGIALLPAVLVPRRRPAARRWALAGADRLVAVERRRRSLFFGEQWPPARQPLPYLLARVGTGLLSGIVLGLLAVGLVLAVLVVRGLVRGSLGGWDLLGQLLLGGVLLFLDLQGVVALARLDTRLARRYLGPPEHEQLRRRIAELSESRAGIVQAVDRERRRIERDLHDGVQQRLVALAVLLGRARRRRDPEAAARLLAQAHQESEDLLVELREVAWRAYPTVLDDLGLAEALAAVAERSGIPVHLELRLPRPLPLPVETAAYFVVSEAVTNAVKHSGAARIDVAVTRHDAGVSVLVSDDGAGGADPGGSGLSGLGLRVAALDGVLAVHSPAGGPTEIKVEIPCD